MRERVFWVGGRGIEGATGTQNPDFWVLPTAGHWPGRDPKPRFLGLPGERLAPAQQPKSVILWVGGSTSRPPNASQAWPWGELPPVTALPEAFFTVAEARTCPS